MKVLLVLRVPLIKWVRKVQLDPPVNKVPLAPLVRRATRILLASLVLRVSEAFWVELVPPVPLAPWPERATRNWFSLQSQ